MKKIEFDGQNPDIEKVRQVILSYLKSIVERHKQPGKIENKIPHGYNTLGGLVDWQGNQRHSETVFLNMMHEVFWELVMQGMIIPGKSGARSAPNHILPDFYFTEYGRQAIVAVDPTPHDPSGYLAYFPQVVSSPDPTVMSYVKESLHSWQRRNHIASMVMLGIAAERVFLLLCDSMLNALSSTKEKQKFQGIMNRFQMQPKLDWMTKKIQQIQSIPNFPDQAEMMVNSVYSIIKMQRNNLGHPQPLPPVVTQRQVFGYLQMFPDYYQQAEAVRTFLATNTV